MDAQQINEDLIQKFAAQIIEKSFADLQDEAQSATFSTTSTSTSSLEPTSATVTDTSKSVTTSDFSTTGQQSPQISDGRAAESSIFENRSFNMADDSMTSFVTPSTKSGFDSSTNKDNFESFLEKTVTDLLDDYYQSPENVKEEKKVENLHEKEEDLKKKLEKRAEIENFYQKLEEKEEKKTKFKLENEENREEKILNFNYNNATGAALQLASYPPTPPNSFLNTPKLALDAADTASTAFEPEKVGQKLRKISEASSMKPYALKEHDFSAKNEEKSTTREENEEKMEQNNQKMGVLKLDLDSVQLNERLQEAMSDVNASDLETAKSTTARSQSMSVQLDWLDDDYIEKNKSDTEYAAPSTSRTHGRGSVSEEDNLTQKSARTENGGVDLEWENDTPVNKEAEKAEIDTSKRRSLKIFGSTHDIDMTIIEPYRKVISHGGYFTDGLTAIVVFSACHLPHRTTPDYQNLMENLFLYAVSSLEKVVAEDYVIVYFQGGASNDQLPSFSWLRKCYRLMDQRLVSYTEPGLDRNMRKNLKQLVLVHSTFWLKTIVTFSKPFISTKFYKKIKFVNSLQELSSLVPLQQMDIPESVLRHEDKKHDDSEMVDTDH